MCITINPSKMSDTCILATAKSNGIHTLTYSNISESLKTGKNLMPILIPTTNIDSIVVKDTRAIGKEFEKLSDIYGKITVRDTNESTSRGIGIHTTKTVFAGNYTVTLASVSNIKEAIEKCGVLLSDSFKDFFTKNYKGWSVALAVWDGNIDISEEPIHIEYMADLFPNYLFTYLMDAHEGNAPIEGNRDLDHILMYNVQGANNGDVYLDHRISVDAMNFFGIKPDEFYGINLNGMGEINGDFWINIAECKKTSLKNAIEGIGSKVIFNSENLQKYFTNN